MAKKDVDEADKVVRRLVKRGAGSIRKSKDSKLGDAFYDPKLEHPPKPGGLRYLEVKSCTNSKRQVNQVRAIRYLPLIVYHKNAIIPNKRWYVFPPDWVVRRVVVLSGGQHTANPLESKNFSLRIGPSASDHLYTCQAKDLRNRILKAIRRGDRFYKLKRLMKEHTRRVNELTDELIDEVRDELRS